MPRSVSFSDLGQVGTVLQEGINVIGVGDSGQVAGIERRCGKDLAVRINGIRGGHRTSTTNTSDRTSLLMVTADSCTVPPFQREDGLPQQSIGNNCGILSLDGRARRQDTTSMSARVKGVKDGSCETPV